MKKYIALVLLLSFIGLLWAQHDTCMQNEDEIVVVEEGASDEQMGDVQHPDLLQLISKPSFIYTQEYFTGEQNILKIIGSNGSTFWRDACCIGAVVVFLVVVAILSIIVKFPWDRGYQTE